MNPITQAIAAGRSLDGSGSPTQNVARRPACRTLHHRRLSMTRLQTLLYIVLRLTLFAAAVVCGAMAVWSAVYLD